MVRNLSQSNMYPGRHSCPGSVGGISLCQGSAISKSRSSHSTVPGALPRLLRQRLRLSVAAHRTLALCEESIRALVDGSGVRRTPKRVLEHWLSVLGRGPACRRQLQGQLDEEGPDWLCALGKLTFFKVQMLGFSCVPYCVCVWTLWELVRLRRPAWCQQQTC